MKKTIDVTRARAALSRLDCLAADHPELLGESTPEEWEETLREVLPVEIYTLKEAAAFLKMHPETVRRAIRNGTLKAGKMSGKDYRISRADLEAYYRASGGGSLDAENKAGGAE